MLSVSDLAAIGALITAAVAPIHLQLVDIKKETRACISLFMSIVSFSGKMEASHDLKSTGLRDPL
jgi:hypothetical protein